MVFLEVRDVPSKLTLPQVVQHLSKVIKGNFQALNFGPIKGSMKVCYVKVTNRLDPRQLLSAINKHTRFSARVIDMLPPKMSGLKKGSKDGKIPLKMRIAHGISSDFAEERPDKIFVMTHSEIMVEMQMKYTGLFNLSKKTGHKLLEEIARTLFERLKQVSELHPESLSTGFKLSGAYRRLHPHFGDFQLILSTLHRLQDAAAAPRAQLSESDLIQPAVPAGVDNLPFEKIQSATAKYSDKISKKISEHVSKLDSDIGPEDTEEEMARKKVREELKKLNPYLPMIIREVITNHFIPRKAPYHKMRIYGEPFLPNKEGMFPVMKKFRAVSIVRSDRMYNVLRFKVPLQQVGPLVAMDGTVVGGAKLVIRSSEKPLYSVPASLVREMRAAFGITAASIDDMEVLDEIQPGDDDEENIEM